MKYSVNSLSGLLVSLATAAEAVTIRNYPLRGCGTIANGAYGECAQTWPNVCCSSHMGSFTSSKFIGLPPTGFGLVFASTVVGSSCNLWDLQGAGWSQEACVDGPTAGLTGAFWDAIMNRFATIYPPDPVSGGVISRSEQSAFNQTEGQTLESSSGGCDRTVGYSAVVLADGRKFATGQHVPEIHSKRLVEYMHANARGDDVPSDLLQYEIEKETLLQRRQEMENDL